MSIPVVVECKCPTDKCKLTGFIYGMCCCCCCCCITWCRRENKLVNKLQFAAGDFAGTVRSVLMVTLIQYQPQI